MYNYSFNYIRYYLSCTCRPPDSKYHGLGGLLGKVKVFSHEIFTTCHARICVA